MLRLWLDPRTTPARRIVTVVWAHLTAEAEHWQIQMLLADCANDVEAHDTAVAILEELLESKRFPYSADPKNGGHAVYRKIRRALTTSWALQAGRPDPYENLVR